MTKPEFVYVTMIAAAPETVWRGLTSPEFTEQYWHRSRIRSDFNPGSPIEFFMEDGSVGVCGEILSADFPCRLAYTWSFMSDSDIADDTPSRVTFELTPLGVGTRLTVVHDRFDANSLTLPAITQGWPYVICGLKTLLETGSAVDFSAAAESRRGSGPTAASA